MTVRRTMDATFLNGVANHPSVRPHLGFGTEPLDLTVVALDPSHILLETEHGGWWLAPILPGVYELHTMFLPSGRGRRYFVAAREALRWVFASTEATEIVTKCPDDNPGAGSAAMLVGFRERFRRENALDGVGVSYRVFSVDDWFIRDEFALEAGRRFHTMMQEAGALSHEDDETHDRAIGAAILMVQAGQPEKGVGFYNRWAVFAGYKMGARIGHNLYDVQDAIVEVNKDDMRVLRVRPPS